MGRAGRCEDKDRKISSRPARWDVTATRVIVGTKAQTNAGACNRHDGMAVKEDSTGARDEGHTASVSPMVRKHEG
jgi:hypothetical protein